MSRLVLDTGALIALEHSDRRVWAALKLSARLGEDVVVPTTVLAQAWRANASQARLAALRHCTLAPFDTMARAIGELCGRAKTSDICDAHVAIVAASSDVVLYTSDVGDLKHLLAVHAQGRPVIVRC